MYKDLDSAVFEFKGAKNPGAFKFIYDSLSKKLYAICFRYLIHTDEAQDALQECFITIFKKIDDYEAKGSFEGWAKRIAINTCLQKIRSKKDFIFFKEDYEIYEVVDDDNDESLYNIEEVMEIFYQLPINYRVVLSLYVIDNLSHKEIGQQLGINENASKVLLSRAKKQFRSKVLNHATK